MDAGFVYAPDHFQLRKGSAICGFILILKFVLQNSKETHLLKVFVFKIVIR